MKILRIIILVLTAAVAFSACESPSDVADKQNVIPIGATPIKSVTVDVQKAVNGEVNNTFKGVNISTSFVRESSFIDLNSKTPYMTLNLEADVPVPQSQNGVFLKNFKLNMNSVIADGRPYMIQGGYNTASPTSAVFNTVTVYNEQGQLRTLNQPVPLTASDSVIIRFTHDQVNRAILGNLQAYIAKDTVIRVPFNAFGTNEADLIFDRHQSMGFEIKNPMPSVDTLTNELVFPATQVFLNVKSSITVQY